MTLNSWRLIRFGRLVGHLILKNDRINWPNSYNLAPALGLSVGWYIFLSVTSDSIQMSNRAAFQCQNRLSQQDSVYNTLQKKRNQKARQYTQVLSPQTQPDRSHRGRRTTTAIKWWKSLPASTTVPSSNYWQTSTTVTSITNDTQNTNEYGIMHGFPTTGNSGEEFQGFKGQWWLQTGRLKLLEYWSSSSWNFCVSIHYLGRFSAIAALPIRMRLGRHRNLYWHCLLAELAK